MAPKPKTVPSHLFVLLHGVAGCGADLESLAAALKLQHGDAAVVLLPTSYRRLASLGGVDGCAHLVLPELRAAVEKHPSLRSLSLLGYSLGGLVRPDAPPSSHDAHLPQVARFLAGLLYAEARPFLGLEALNLVTFACPHLGALDPRPGALSARRGLLRACGGTTGQQLALADKTSLLMLMAHPRSVFARGLAAFRRRALYAAASNDRTVPFWTAFLSPFQDGAPLPPPRALAEPPRYPHVEWEGEAGGEGEGEGEAAAAEGTPSEESASGPSPAAADALGPGSALACVLLAPLVILCLALAWLLLLPLLLLLSACSPAPPALAAKLLALERTEEVRCMSWRNALAGDDSELAAARAAPQAWMAACLNRHGWHKVSVRFTLARDGLQAVHTHGTLVDRRRLLNGAGADVLRHCAETLLASEAWSDFAVRLASLGKKGRRK